MCHYFAGCVSQWSVDKAIDVFLQLACGVKHLHACGVLHRDLKTDNALIQSVAPLVVKWADFGCSVKLDMGHSTYGDGATVFYKCDAFFGGPVGSQAVP